MVCLGFKSGMAGWWAQTNYSGHQRRSVLKKVMQEEVEVRSLATRRRTIYS